MKDTSTGRAPSPPRGCAWHHTAMCVCPKDEVDDIKMEPAAATGDVWAPGVLKPGDYDFDLNSE